MAVTVTEQQARDVVEAARETEWKLPSFGKELFLGNFRLDLIHPQPPLDPIAVEKGERFLQSLRAFLENENVIAKEGQGLKIALTTLNTGRLALPAICVGSAKWATRVAR